MTHYLYRHFGAEGKLLYVGIAGDWMSRTGNHRRYSKWFDDVATIKIEKFPTRAKVLKAEVAAIATEKPIHNRTHNRRSLSIEYFLKNHKGSKITSLSIDSCDRDVVAAEIKWKMESAGITIPVLAAFTRRSEKAIKAALNGGKVDYYGSVFSCIQEGLGQLFRYAYANRKRKKFITV